MCVYIYREVSLCTTYNTDVVSNVSRPFPGCAGARGSQRLHQMLALVPCCEHFRVWLLGQELLVSTQIRGRCFRGCSSSSSGLLRSYLPTLEVSESTKSLHRTSLRVPCMQQAASWMNEKQRLPPCWRNGLQP